MDVQLRVDTVLTLARNKCGTYGLTYILLASEITGSTILPHALDTFEYITLASMQAASMHTASMHMHEPQQFL